MTGKLVAISGMGLLAQAAPVGDSILDVVAKLGALGVVITLLVWIVVQQQKRIDHMSERMEAQSESNSKALAESKAVLEKMSSHMEAMEREVRNMSDRVISFLSTCEEKSDPERRAAEWKPGDPDRRASAEPRDPGGRHS